MYNNARIIQPELDELLDNPEPRVANIFIIQASRQVGSKYLSAVNCALRSYRDEIYRDDLLTKRIETSIILSGESARQLHGFHTLTTSINHELTAGEISTNHVSVGPAITLAINKLRERKAVYRENQIKCFRPSIFLVTDETQLEDSAEELSNLQTAIHACEQANEFRFFVFYSDGVDKSKLNILSSKHDSISLGGLNFRGLFSWLVGFRSGLGCVSTSSKPDDTIMQLPPVTWATI